MAKRLAGRASLTPETALPGFDSAASAVMPATVAKAVKEIKAANGIAPVTK